MPVFSYTEHLIFTWDLETEPTVHNDDYELHHNYPFNGDLFPIYKYTQLIL